MHQFNSVPFVLWHLATSHDLTCGFFSIHTAVFWGTWCGKEVQLDQLIKAQDGLWRAAMTLIYYMTFVRNDSLKLFVTLM